MTEPTKVTLYADDKPYQVIDLKDIDDMSEEEYNDKLKDAWLKKTHYETVEELKELTMAKYYNYEVEEEKKEEHKDNSEIILGGIMYSTIGLIVFYILYELVKSFFGG